MDESDDPKKPQISQRVALTIAVVCLLVPLSCLILTIGVCSQRLG